MPLKKQVAVVGCEVWGEEEKPEELWSSCTSGVSREEIQQTMAGPGPGGENIHSLQLKVTSLHKTSPEGLNHCTMTQ